MEELVEARGGGVAEVTVGTAMGENLPTHPAEVAPTLGTRHLVAAVYLLPSQTVGSYTASQSVLFLLNNRHT